MVLINRRTALFGIDATRVSPTDTIPAVPLDRSGKGAPLPAVFVAASSRKRNFIRNQDTFVARHFLCKKERKTMSIWPGYERVLLLCGTEYGSGVHQKGKDLRWVAPKQIGITSFKIKIQAWKCEDSDIYRRVKKYSFNYNAKQNDTFLIPSSDTDLLTELARMGGKMLQDGFDAFVFGSQSHNRESIAPLPFHADEGYFVDLRDIMKMTDLEQTTSLCAFFKQKGLDIVTVCCNENGQCSCIRVYDTHGLDYMTKHVLVCTLADRMHLNNHKNKLFAGHIALNSDNTLFVDLQSGTYKPTFDHMTWFTAHLQQMFPFDKFVTVPQYEEETFVYQTWFAKHPNFQDIKRFYRKYQFAEQAAARQRTENAS